MPRDLCRATLLALAALTFLSFHPSPGWAAEEPAALSKKVQELESRARRAENILFLSLAVAALAAAGVSYTVARLMASGDLARRQAESQRELDGVLQGAVEAIRAERERAARFSLFLMDGLKEFEQENYEAAQRACEEALAADDRSAVAWTVKGVALLKRSGRPEEALEALDKALAIDPALTLALTARGAALVALERNEEALAAFAGALETDPKSVVALTGRGAALVLLERHAEALEAFSEALGHDPRNAPAWAGKGVVLVGLGRPEEALVAFDEALAFAPSYAPAWYNKACALGRLGRRDEMLEALGQALHLDPAYGEKAREDSDLEPFRDDPAFQAILGGAGPPA